MLDRTAKQSIALSDVDIGDVRRGLWPVRSPDWAKLLHSAAGVRHIIVGRIFSSLTRRIVILNIAGLLALVMGVLFLTHFRAGLIDARVQSLVVQGEIIASAVSASATAETNTITIDPDRLMELQTGQSFEPTEEGLEFSINPERVAPVLRRLVLPTQTRARIYDNDGVLLVDSRNLYGRGDVLRFDLASPNAEKPGFFERQWRSVRKWLGRGDLPLYQELGPANGKGYPEVAHAIAGEKASIVRANDRGDVVVSVAVPVQRFRAVHGVLLLSTQGGEIDDMVEAERYSIFKVFLVAAGVMIILSVLFAGTIAEPVKRLAEGAERVRNGVRSRVEIPDFSERGDEIGHLSSALRDMTDALYNRIEGIERFAADVAHELKNPLTSLRSAVETLPLARKEESKQRLLAIIAHDVKRLDRLISDISDASRLDAELQRERITPVDLVRLLTTVVNVANEVRRDGCVNVSMQIDKGGPSAFMFPGHDSRIGQVFHNLIDNARSFSPETGDVRVRCSRRKNEIEVLVDDDGPGIRPDALARIFERFYTDRPHQNFGDNSGLGLSISQQIVEAHGGRIWAENRVGPSVTDFGPAIRGARFVVRIPAL